MSLRRRESIARFCWSVIDGRNKYVGDIIREYKHSIESRIDIQGMNFKQETFSRDLTNICDVLFTIRRVHMSYIMAVLAFSIELNDYLTNHSSWYNTELLIQTLTNIFLDVGFDPDKITSSYRCTIL